MKICNAFSLNMVAAFPANISVVEVSLADAQQIAVKCESAVGHADTAAVFTNVLGVDVAAVRSTLSLEKGEEVLVGQYVGPRLPEGATELPAGATIKWLKVTVQ